SLRASAVRPGGPVKAGERGEARRADLIPERQPGLRRALRRDHLDSTTRGVPVIYLSRLYLNPRNRAVRLDLGDCHALHRTVLRAFPGVIVPAPTTDGSD